MCSSNLDSLVEDAANLLCSNGEAFTAFEVTKRLRDAGVDVRHYAVKETLGELFFNDNLDEDYTRTSHFVDSSKGSAFVYHPTSMDDNGIEFYLDFVRGNKDGIYDPSHIQNIPPTILPISIPVGCQAHTTSLSCAHDDHEVTKAVDMKNRLRIPASFMRAIGAKPHEFVNVLVDTLDSKIVVSKGQMASTAITSVRPLAVDNYNNLRINLVTSGLSNAKYKIEIDDTGAYKALIATPA